MDNKYEEEMLRLFRRMKPEKQDAFLRFFSWLTAHSEQRREESQPQDSDEPHQLSAEDE